MRRQVSLNVLTSVGCRGGERDQLQRALQPSSWNRAAICRGSAREHVPGRHRSAGGTEADPGQLLTLAARLQIWPNPSPSALLTLLELPVWNPQLSQGTQRCGPRLHEPAATQDGSTHVPAAVHPAVHPQSRRQARP